MKTCFILLIFTLSAFATKELDINRQLGDYGVCDFGDTTKCENNFSQTSCCIDDTYLKNGAYCSSWCSYFDVSKVGDGTIYGCLQGFELGLSGSSSKSDCVANEIQKNNEQQNIFNLMDNAQTYLNRNNYFSASTMMNGIGKYFQKYEKGACENIIVKFAKWLWSCITWIFSIIDKCCLAVKKFIDGALKVLLEDANPEHIEIAEELAAWGLEKIPGVGFWFKVAQGVCDIAAGNSQTSIKTVLKTAKVQDSTIELTDNMISTANSFKEGYSFLMAINDNIENTENCQQLYFNAAVYLKLKSTEDYYSFKLGMGAGVFLKSIQSCQQLLKDNKDDIVDKYTKVNRGSSSRRVLDESVYYLPENKDEDANDSGNSLLTYDPQCLFCIQESTFYDFLQGYYDGQTSLDNKMVSNIDIKRCLKLSDELTEIYQTGFSQALVGIMNHYRSNQIEETYKDIQNLVTKIDAVIQNNTCFEHDEVARPDTIKDDGQVQFNRTQQRAFWVSKNNPEDFIELTLVIDIIVKLSEEFFQLKQTDSFDKNHTQGIELGQFLGKMTKVQATAQAKETTLASSNGSTISPTAYYIATGIGIAVLLILVILITLSLKRKNLKNPLKPEMTQEKEEGVELEQVQSDEKL